MQIERGAAAARAAELLSMPLAGRRVVVTRSASQGQSLVKLLTEQGANVVHIPVVRIGPPSDASAVRRVLEKVATFDWIVFTSANAVHAVVVQLRSETGSGKFPKVAAVGSATARAVTASGLPVHYETEGNGYGLANTLPQAAGANILLPQSSIASRSVADELRARGAKVTEVITYQTQRDEQAAARIHSCFAEPVDAVLFTSPSTVQSFLESAWIAGMSAASIAASGTTWVCIGATTSRALEESGLHADAVAEHPSDAALVSATAGLFHD